MKKLTQDQKPSDKKSVKAKAARKAHPDIIYLGQKYQDQQSDINAQK
tara:strand:- start:726 stop:866 length:141 start_codon:yes stop_codon:yes gene_type:complete